MSSYKFDNRDSLVKGINQLLDKGCTQFAVMEDDGGWIISFKGEVA